MKRIDIAPWARQQMTPDERRDVEQTCRTRGLTVRMQYSAQRRGFVAYIATTSGSQPSEGVAAKPYEAWNRALAARERVELVTLLGGPAA